MNYNINDNIMSMKLSLLNAICHCMTLLDTEVENLYKIFNPALIELMTCLGSNQDDNNFLAYETKAFGKYLKSKGCTKEDIELITTCIIDCLE